MIALFEFGKKKKVKLFTENDTRDDLVRRAIVNQVGIKEALNAPKTVSTPKKMSTAPKTTLPNPHAATIQKLDEILGKVAGFENSKIATVAELALALETGDFKNLIKLLKTKDKVVKVKTKY